MIEVFALLAAAVALAIASAVRSLVTRLPEGSAANALVAFEAALRLGAVGAIGIAIAGWVPGGNAVPYVIFAMALAVGWSVRDLLHDLVARLVILAQGRIRPGRRVSGDGFSGRVVRMGLLAVQVQDRPGERTSVPNRAFLGRSFRVSDHHTAPAEVVVTLPGLSGERARSALREAVFLAPWIAPDPRVEVGLEPGAEDVWRVRVHLVEPRFVPLFSGSFAERVREVVGRASTPTTAPE